MIYRYRNVKTKEVITTTNKVSGKNWAPVVDEIPEDDSVEEETVVEDTPVQKPKATRRGKK